MTRCFGARETGQSETSALLPDLCAVTGSEGRPGRLVCLQTSQWETLYIGLTVRLSEPADAAPLPQPPGGQYGSTTDRNGGKKTEYEFVLPVTCNVSLEGDR